MAAKYFIPALAWGAVIFAAISMPPSSIPKTGLFAIPLIDKVIHFFLFAVFGFLGSFGFFKQEKDSFFHRRFIFLAIIAGLIYGSITELLQHYYFTGRQGSGWDVLADLFGTVFGVGLFRLVMKFKPQFFI